jgi:hypothetical protein
MPWVYSIDRPVMIVADDDEWSCSKVKSFLDNANGLEGQSELFPARFIFYPVTKKMFKDAKSYLTSYGINYDGIFSGINVRKNDVVINDKTYDGKNVDGAFFDRQGFGYFSLYFFKHGDFYYSMFIQIDTDSLSDDEREKFFENTFKLVTPVYP